MNRDKRLLPGRWHSGLSPSSVALIPLRSQRTPRTPRRSSIVQFSRPEPSVGKAVVVSFRFTHRNARAAVWSHPYLSSLPICRDVSRYRTLTFPVPVSLQCHVLLINLKLLSTSSAISATCIHHYSALFGPQRAAGEPRCAHLSCLSRTGAFRRQKPAFIGRGLSVL